MLFVFDNFDRSQQLSQQRTSSLDARLKKVRLQAVGYSVIYLNTLLRPVLASAFQRILERGAFFVLNLLGFMFFHLKGC